MGCESEGVVAEGREGGQAASTEKSRFVSEVLFCGDS